MMIGRYENSVPEKLPAYVIKYYKHHVKSFMSAPHTHRQKLPHALPVTHMQHLTGNLQATLRRPPRRRRPNELQPRGVL